MVNSEDGCQHLMCKALKKTWANQRRKRRLAATQHQQTAPKKPKESTEVGEGHSDDCKKADISVTSQTIPIELCHFEFSCIFNRTDVNLVQFKWLGGDNKDNLHQVAQYLKNQAQLSVQTA